MINQGTWKLLCEKAVHQLYNNRMESDLIMSITNYCCNINLFSTIRKHDTMYKGEPIDSINVIDEFVPFIQPKSLSFDPSDELCPDLLIHNLDVIKTYNTLLVQDCNSWIKDKNLQINGKSPEFKFNNSNFNKFEFQLAGDSIRSILRKDRRSNIVTLNNIKVDESLNNVIYKLTFSKDDSVRVHDSNDYFYPLTIKEGYVNYLFMPEYFNLDYEVMVKEFINSKISFS